MTEHEPSGRVLAFEAIVRLAIEEANEDSGWGHRPDLERADVEREISGEVSTRTVDRALRDAAALDWLEDRRQGWDAGPRAEDYHPAIDLPGDPVE